MKYKFDCSYIYMKDFIKNCTCCKTVERTGRCFFVLAHYSFCKLCFAYTFYQRGDGICGLVLFAKLSKLLALLRFSTHWLSALRFASTLICTQEVTFELCSLNIRRHWESCQSRSCWCVWSRPPHPYRLRPDSYSNERIIVESSTLWIHVYNICQRHRTQRKWYLPDRWYPYIRMYSSMLDSFPTYIARSNIVKLFNIPLNSVLMSVNVSTFWSSLKSTYGDKSGFTVTNPDIKS